MARGSGVHQLAADSLVMYSGVLHSLLVPVQGLVECTLKHVALLFLLNKMLSAGGTGHNHNCIKLQSNEYLSMQTKTNTTKWKEFENILLPLLKIDTVLEKKENQNHLTWFEMGLQ